MTAHLAPDDPAATAHTVTDVDPSAGSHERHLCFVGGWGALLAFGGWLLQPLLVLILIGDAEPTTYAGLQDTAWTSGYELVTFSIVAAGLMLMTGAVRSLSLASGGTRATAPAAQLGYRLGSAGAIAWFALGAVTASPFSSAATDLGDLATADQTATITAYGVTQMAVLLFAVICIAGWLAMLATVGRRIGLFGIPTAIFTGLCSAAAFAPFFVPFAPPVGTLAVFLAVLVLGVRLLLGGRRSRTT